jgi:phage anti-repressor protein
MTNLSVFNQDKANELFNSTNAFPINFDDAWRWLEYSTKQKGMLSFTTCEFTESIDFIRFNQKVKSGIVERELSFYSLTIDCFKSWAMMSKTQTGKQVRLYFLECERIAKQKVQRVIPEKLDVANSIQSLHESTLPASVKQLLIDSLVNEYIDNTPKLEASTERWVGLVQKAQELGFRINSSNRVKLGHYGTKEQSRLSRQKEERLCNGEMREIWVYLDNEELETVIREYFAIEAISLPK